jgi:hypothetical protein
VSGSREIIRYPVNIALIPLHGYHLVDRRKKFSGKSVSGNLAANPLQSVDGRDRRGRKTDRVNDRTGHLEQARGSRFSRLTMVAKVIRPCLPHGH